MPRSWPPVSVWLLAGVLVQALVTFGVLKHRLTFVNDAVDRATSAAAVGGTLLAAGLLLSGRRAGHRTAGVMAAGYAAAAALAVYTLYFHAVGPLAVAVGAAAVAPPVVQVALLGWPATRRWCGLLPPADPEADA